MHMADALLSPAVGVTFWAASGAALTYCANRAKRVLDDHKVPLMGVLGAFIFAAQMINFTIPGTGSSGHIGGGLLLALLLGPHAAFLTISSVLVVQAFFFADGGLLALGTNIFNLGVFPCFVGLPLFRLIAGKSPAAGRMTAAAVFAAAAGLELGALGVVLETLISGRSELRLAPFLALMGGIHLPIGVIEGFVTAAVLGYIHKVRPELRSQAYGTPPDPAGGTRSLFPVLVSLALATVLAGGVLAWFASSNPDGLEWSIERITGGAGLRPAAQGLPDTLAKIQRTTAIFPEHTVPATNGDGNGTAEEPTWPAVDRGTTGAGIAGAVVTLVAAAVFGFLLTRCRRATGARGGGASA